MNYRLFSRRWRRPKSVRRATQKAQKKTRRGPLKLPARSRRVLSRHPSPKVPLQGKPTTPVWGVKPPGAPGPRRRRTASARLTDLRTMTPPAVAGGTQVWLSRHGTARRRPPGANGEGSWPAQYAKPELPGVYAGTSPGLPDPIKRHVERRGAVRQTTDADALDAGEGDLANCCERDAARRLKLDRRRRLRSAARRPDATRPTSCCREAPYPARPAALHRARPSHRLQFRRASLPRSHRLPLAPRTRGRGAPRPQGTSVRPP